MTFPQYSTPYRKRRRLRGHPLAVGLARFMALIAVVNLGLVFFDLSYIQFRDFYFLRFPWLVKHYDPIKGIVPYRDTENYLETVQQLQSAHSTVGITQAKSTALLQSLRSQSVAMVDENPFQLADKSGTLEKIKNRMRDRLGVESSKEAFQTFWSVQYLSQKDANQELDWFDKKIAPLIASNYFRPIGENGDFVDFFWIVDIGFTSLFALDLLVRIFVIRRRRPEIGLIDAMLWRWYDWFLLLPFWRFLRVLPVTLRVHQVGWIDLGRIENQVTQYLAEHLLEDLSEMILVRAFNMAQLSVKEGAFKKIFSIQADLVEINDVNEVQVITERLMSMMVMKVFPTIQPELEAVLRHAIEQSLAQLPLYQGLQFMPGAQRIPQEITRQVVHQVTDLTFQTLEQTLKDEKGQALASRLAQCTVQSLQAELQDADLLRELQQLIGDMLEEWKLTLVQSFEEQDVEKTASEVAKIRQSQAIHPQKSTVEVLSPQKSLSSASSKIR